MGPGLIAIGSGPGGLRAAETFRGLHPRISVRILSADPAMPYARPPLSKDFLCGKAIELGLHSQEWFERRGIELVRGVTVARIDTANREVVTTGGRRYPYWHLVLASGSRAMPLAAPGGESALLLRSLGDAVAMRMAARYAETAVVVGAGLVGCEAAGALTSSGVQTTLVDAESVPLQRRFGADAGAYVAKILADNGIRFVGQAGVAAVESDGVLLGSGERIAGDLVVATTGHRPECGLAAAAGIATRAGRVLVDEHMHTSAPNVYAAGDVALAFHPGARRYIAAEHWQDAAGQGAVAGASAAGFPASWRDMPEFTCVIGDFTLRYRGWGAGYQHARFIEHDDGFTVRYEADGELIGVLTYAAGPKASRGV
jgi:3-phenylpropionate/trans-cinnamate dioxygenase ferredoxin reductase component